MSAIFESLKENMAESLQILGLGRCAFESEASGDRRV